MAEQNLTKGRGAQINPTNRYASYEYSTINDEGVDDHGLNKVTTQYKEENPSNIISKSNSPDLGFMLSINPYQGCEHGCVYCYARNSHEYWGCGPGLDFEQKIFIKKNAAELLEKAFNRPNYSPDTIFMSGNTDCYQPIERKLKLTRSILSIFLKYKHPVSLITKNSLILRDIDLLTKLSRLNLVRVAISLTSLQEELRNKLEPRTVTASGRLKVIKTLSDAGIPVMLMCAPVIPGLNSMEIPQIIQAAAQNGARSASYTIIRLNGAVAAIFEDWLIKAYPDRAAKVLNGIRACHGGKLHDSQWGRRIKGAGNEAETIRQLFHIAKLRYMGEEPMTRLRTDLFSPRGGSQLKLFN